MSHYRLIVRCDEFPHDHAKKLRVDPVMGRRFVELLAGLLDGKSPMYMYAPGPNSSIGKCATCGATLTSEIEERSDDLPEDQFTDEEIVKLTHRIFADEEGDDDDECDTIPEHQPDQPPGAERHPGSQVIDGSPSPDRVAGSGHSQRARGPRKAEANGGKVRG